MSTRLKVRPVPRSGGTELGETYSRSRLPGGTTEQPLWMAACPWRKKYLLIKGLGFFGLIYGDLITNSPATPEERK